MDPVRVAEAVLRERHGFTPLRMKVEVEECVGVSAVYELLEWAAAVALGEGADAFLATQGDVWDTQKDMLMAGIGAAVAVLFFSRWHDRALAKLK